MNVSGLAAKNSDCQSSCDDRIRIIPQTSPVLEINLALPQSPIFPPKLTTSFILSIDKYPRRVMLLLIIN